MEFLSNDEFRFDLPLVYSKEGGACFKENVDFVKVIFGMKIIINSP